MSQLRFAIRSVLKTPIVTTVAVLSMALGIGANVAIFSIFNQTLSRPLPVNEPERLVNLVAPGVRAGSVSCGQGGDCDSVFRSNVLALGRAARRRDSSRISAIRRSPLSRVSRTLPVSWTSAW